MLTRQRSQSSGHLTMQRSGFYKYACTFILPYSIGIRTFTTVYSVQYPVSVPCPSHTCHTTPAHMQSYAFVHVYIYKRTHSNNRHNIKYYFMLNGIYFVLTGSCRTSNLILLPIDFCVLTPCLTFPSFTQNHSPNPLWLPQPCLFSQR